MLAKLIDVNYGIANCFSMIANMAVIVLLHCKSSRKLLGPYRWIIQIAAALQFSSSFATLLVPYKYVNAPVRTAVTTGLDSFYPAIMFYFVFFSKDAFDFSTNFVLTIGYKQNATLSKRYHLFMSLAILLFCLLIVLEEFLYMRGVEITYDMNHYVLKRSTREVCFPLEKKEIKKIKVIYKFVKIWQF
ncbi:unnamed protein product [Gongylonema pulchrum]|uniref:7TM_GPCR_Srx domain-containing protein n=1 Tax=Gongylonema pulchrum TaxID=637853 RepID=A0A183D4K8_9BILA|nr:unnamed protein product [Gongylonema pulchrum]